MKKIVKITLMFSFFALGVLIVNKQVTVNILKQKVQTIKTKNIIKELRNDKDSSFIKNADIFKKNLVYVINLWGSRCKPCIQEMPELNELYDKHKLKPVKFIALSRYNDDSIKFSKLNLEFKFRKYYDEGKLFDYFQNLSPSKNKVIPITILINKKGYIEYYFEGASSQNIKLIDMYLSSK